MARINLPAKFDFATFINMVKGQDARIEASKKYGRCYRSLKPKARPCISSYLLETLLGVPVKIVFGKPSYMVFQTDDDAVFFQLRWL